MRTFAGAVTASLIGVAAFSGAASADNFFELEHARANARAGGPSASAMRSCSTGTAH